ncbi:hypothetical protein LZ30DRAFT_387649 [Colletotrichum cereale]|nr:hypothetical protein LZ30DRAFT_387649 [Colletotrichum cereale]
MFVCFLGSFVAVCRDPSFHYSLQWPYAVCFCNNPRIRNIRFKDSFLLLILSLVGASRQLEKWGQEQESRDEGIGRSKDTCTHTHTRGERWEVEGELRKHGGEPKCALSRHVGGPSTGEVAAGADARYLASFLISDLLLFVISTWTSFAFGISAMYLSKLQTTGTSQQLNVLYRHGHGHLTPTAHTRRLVALESATATSRAWST